MAAPDQKGRVLRKGIEAFYEGQHVDSQGNSFPCTRQDLLDMAKNFSVLSSGDRPVLQPPIGIDHDTAQFIPDELLSNPKLSMGDVVSAYTGMGKIEGKPTMFLFVDAAVEPKTDMLIDKGYLTAVSAEVDDRPIDGAKGFSLRRLSLLGTNQPALKRLKRLGTLGEGTLAPAGFSEAKHSVARPRVQKLLNDKGESQGVAFFCEMGCSTAFKGASNMDRQQTLDWLQQHGVDTSTITDAVPDALLMMLYTLMDENEKLKGAAPAGDPNAAAMSDKPASREPKQVTMRYSDLEPHVNRAVTRALAPTLAKLKADQEKNDTDTKNRAALEKGRTLREIRTFCEQMVTAGKMRSADTECDKDGNPMPLTELASLFRAADQTGVHKFSEAGRETQGTVLEVEMAKIKARPARTFRELGPAQKAGALGGDKGPTDLARDQANKYADRLLALRGQKVA